MWLGGMMNLAVFWLVAVIVLLAVEALVPGLISIWFALGALAALIAALTGAPLWLQIIWFVLISVITLLLTRPLAKKYINSRTVPTNADVILGKECVVTEPIDNVMGTGAVSAGGKIWTARMDRDIAKAYKGDRVRAVRIEGVKLIVTTEAEE